MIVHSVTGLAIRCILAAILDAHERGILTPTRTPELWTFVEALLAWCSMSGDETTGPANHATARED